MRLSYLPRRGWVAGRSSVTHSRTKRRLSGEGRHADERPSVRAAYDSAGVSGHEAGHGANVALEHEDDIAHRRFDADVLSPDGCAVLDKHGSQSYLASDQSLQILDPPVVAAIADHDYLQSGGIGQQHVGDRRQWRPALVVPHDDARRHRGHRNQPTLRETVWAALFISSGDPP